MALKPGQPNPPYHIELTDGKSRQTFGLKIDGKPESAIELSSMSDEGNAVVIRAANKMIGEFDEQRSWKSGRGFEYLSANPEGYYDGHNIWSLSPDQLTPSPQLKIATGGYRNFDGTMPGSVEWKPLFGDMRYITTTFTASASYNQDKCLVWIRRRGKPGVLTSEHCPNSAGNPGTATKTTTTTTTTITDVVSVLHEFDWTTTQAVVSGTIYHIKIYGAATDNDVNHWEVGVNTSGSSSKYSSNGTDWYNADFTMYFLASDTDTDRRWYSLAHSVANFWVVDQKASGNSQLFKWNETTDVFEEVAGTGLATVSSRPIYNNNIIYFPQGESTAIRRYDGTTFAADGTNYASFLCLGQDPADGPQIWRGTYASNFVGVSRANATPWGTDLTFRTGIACGEYSYGITSLCWFNNQLWVFKSNSVWVVSGDRAEWRPYGVEDTPTLPYSYNGVASAAHGEFLYWNWAFSTERLYGSILDDVGQGWNGPALPDGREGIDSCYRSYLGWLFVAKDAGTTGTSSVMCFDGNGWHEMARAWKPGLRIRHVNIQPTAGRPRVWFDCGDYLCYFELPYNKANPLDDPAFNYQHEGVVESSTIDMGTASRLPKFIRKLVALTKNLTTGIYIDVDYQVDTKIGLKGISNWTPAQALIESPETESEINAANIRQFRYRFRMHTNSSITPPIVRGVSPSGAARTPFKRVWSIRFLTGEIFTSAGTKAIDPNLLFSWIWNMVAYPGRIHMTSVFKYCHDYYVLIVPPNVRPVQQATYGTPEKSSSVITLIEM